ARFIVSSSLILEFTPQGRNRCLATAANYSSLLGQCLRLVSYAIGVLPQLRLRAFYRRSSLPPLCIRIAGTLVAAACCDTPAANNYGRGGAKRSRLLDILSLTKRHRPSRPKPPPAFSRIDLGCPGLYLLPKALSLGICQTGRS